MKFQAEHPVYLLLLPLVLGWIFWLTWKTDVQVGSFRRWFAFALRACIGAALVLALAGLEVRWPLEGVNVFYLLDRSESIANGQKEQALEYVRKSVYGIEKRDRGGAIVFGSEASIEAGATEALKLDKVDSVIGTERTDIGAAIQLGTIAFPGQGQKRLVLISDGNENTGDAIAATAAAQSLGVSVDVLAIGSRHGNDVSIQKLTVPSNVKKGQTFEAKIFLHSDMPHEATIHLFRNDQFLGSQKVRLSAGKNLFTFPQSLPEPGFYSYDARVEAEGDSVPQDNRASAFSVVRGDPRVLVVSTDPDADQPLARALESAGLEVKSGGLNAIPATLPEMQSYDSIFLSNVAAGDLGTDTLKLLESAVRDFGVGLVCIGGDQAFTAGAYRGTPLEEILPVDMELDSKKVLPSGALVLVIDKSGSMGGQKIEMVKDAAMGAVAALGANDYVGVIAFDGGEVIVAELQKASNKKEILQAISGLHASGGTAMYPPMVRAHEWLKSARANLKHCVVLTDGDSLGGDFMGVTHDMAADRISVSTVGVGTDVNGKLLSDIASTGLGRYYEVTSPDILPQIFIKETAVILKSAIFEDAFRPQLKSAGEVVRGIAAADYPSLLGYVGTTAKPRAEVPLWTERGDPLLAHWQFGLGRTVAFTSDARAKWARNWLGWGEYKQFWTQIAQWSLRRLENADFETDVTVDKGRGLLSVEALDERGNYRNFLDLKATVISPKGDKTTVPVSQSGAGHYEARFPVREPGLYMVNLAEMNHERVVSSMAVGASVNYSPEYGASEPNWNLLRRVAEMGHGRILNPDNPTDDNPFRHDREKSYRSFALWEWLMRFAILLFPLDVAVRRVQLDAEEIAKTWRWLMAKVLPGRAAAEGVEAAVTLSALLSRRDEVRTQRPAVMASAGNESMFTAKEMVADSSEPRPKMVSTVKTEAKTSEETIEERPPGDTAGRLLAAKRRANSRRK